MTTPTVAVIGAGASGTLASLHLLRLAPTRIVLIERNAPPGPGLAYGTGNPNHLLNVPAGRMSAFAGQPRQFLDWLRSQPPEILDGVQPSEAAFVPRRLYGAYLRHLLHSVLPHPALQVLRDTAVAIDGPLLRLASGHSVRSDLVVLATGNEQPAALRHAPLGSPHWRADPWTADAWTALDPHAPVLLVGTGLTMVDAVITLLDQGHAGPIHAVSRRGLLPQPHGAASAVPLPALPADLRSLMRIVRRHASQAGANWRGVIDALRPATQQIWQTLSLEDRQRFLRHLRPWWDVHRHRMPIAIAGRIAAARASGQLRVHAGRIVSAGEDVRLRLCNGAIMAMRFARVVNCTGPCTDVTGSRDPLLRQLLRDGLARPDPCHLGFDVTTDGALVCADGTVSHTAFALGPLTRGRFWEITAIPDIRQQAETLAAHLSQHLRSRANTGNAVIEWRHSLGAFGDGDRTACAEHAA